MKKYIITGLNNLLIIGLLIIPLYWPVYSWFIQAFLWIVGILSIFTFIILAQNLKKIDMICEYEGKGFNFKKMYDKFKSKPYIVFTYSFDPFIIFLYAQNDFKALFVVKILALIIEAGFVMELKDKKEK